MSTRDGCFVICPFCAYQHGSAWEWCKEEAEFRNCAGCGKEFIYYAEHLVNYVAKVPLTDLEKGIMSAN